VYKDIRERVSDRGAKRRRSVKGVRLEEGKVADAVTQGEEGVGGNCRGNPHSPRLGYPTYSPRNGVRWQ